VAALGGYCSADRALRHLTILSTGALRPAALRDDRVASWADSI
jgi:hypothetical protein